MSRSYDISGVEYPSVTTILSLLDKGDAITNWAVKQATKFIRDNRGNREQYPDLDSLLGAAETEWRGAKEEAADIGSEIHGIIERYIQHGRDALGGFRPEVENGFLAFLEWEQAHKIQWVKSEMTVISNTYGFAGTLDAICIYEGKQYVIDFKSSKGFWDTFGKQISAYRIAAAEMGHPTDGCGILRLDKITGIPEFKDYTKNQEKEGTAFLKLVEFYYADKDRRLKNNPFTIKAKNQKKE